MKPLRWVLAGLAVVVLFALLTAFGFNLGQQLTWFAFLSSLAAGLGFMAAAGGRDGAWRPARVFFVLQWFALASATVFLWRILFKHQFEFQYVASYSSRAMPPHYVYAAFWGGQEGTFVLWALITCTIGLVMMRGKHPLTRSAMFFLNLPLVMLTLVTVIRGPFLMFPAGRVPSPAALVAASTSSRRDANASSSKIALSQ